MHERLDLAALREDAEQFILANDRMLYVPFLTRVEEFCITDNVLVGGRVGSDLLVGNPATKDSFVWDLYCENAFETCKRLADALAAVTSPHVPARTVALDTKIRNREYVIRVHARVLVQVFGVNRHRGVSLLQLMRTQRNGYFTGRAIPVITEELQLIDTYHALYTPRKCSAWVAELQHESKLRDLMTAGTARTADATRTARTTRTADAARTAALLRFLTDTDHVVVGDHAIGHVLTEVLPTRLQFITAMPIREVAAACSKHMSTRITYIQYPLHLPSDFQLTKHTLYSGNTPVADVYNSSAYEMVPYWSANGLKYGNPWVLLRFLLIDVHALRLLFHLGHAHMEARIDALMAMSVDLRKHLDMSVPERLFQLHDYVGVFIEDSLAKKKIIAQLGEHFGTYYPAKKTGGDASAPMPMSAPMPAHFVSRELDLEFAKRDKRDIFRRITGQQCTDLADALREHHGRARGATWAVNKSVDRLVSNNRKLLQFVPKLVHHHLDLGCGSGLDMQAIARYTRVQTSTCADVRDHRVAPGHNFVQIRVGEALEFPDANFDLITCFHVLHHAVDAEFRLRDMVRCLQPGGILLIKDHDVRSEIDASNVDFEHWVYDVVSGVRELRDMARYHELEPMYYFNFEQVAGALKTLGLTLLWHKTSTSATRVYRAAFMRA